MKVDDYHDFSIHRWKSQKNTSKYFTFKDKEGKICCCTWIINTGNHPVLVNYLCDSCRMQKFSISQKRHSSKINFWNTKMPTVIFVSPFFVLIVFVFQKYAKFGCILLGHFTKHILLILEEWNIRSQPWQQGDIVKKWSLTTSLWYSTL